MRLLPPTRRRIEAVRSSRRVRPTSGQAKALRLDPCEVDVDTLIEEIENACGISWLIETVKQTATA
jgi:hypothetical protein